MNKYQILVLKSLRKVYTTLFKSQKEMKPNCIYDAAIASKIIYDTLMANKPCMIARFGGFELSTLSNNIGVLKGCILLDFIKSKQPQ